MYLKNIEVQGFKSFANRIVFEFHNGITGIVGPNGSGKSNVADAVRWVLGEQRARQLRGGSMQDVIFSGTEMRRPQSYAAVSITLDNSDRKLAADYDEVRVTRRLYRSGESEYMLNGTDCRLKDIQDLFYDTGIGKEGYSIIGQGQVDRILSGKPEERRELFDEAAGIVKFKKRKAVSLKKLENERANLVRVDDILRELERQKGPLEKQSETAKEYLRKKEELKAYDVNIFLLETERLSRIGDDLDRKIQTAEDELSSVTESYEGAKDEYLRIEEELEGLEDAIRSAQKKASETTLLKQQLEGNINVLNEQIIQVQLNDEHIADRIRAIDAGTLDRESQRDILLGEQKDLRETLTEKKRLETAADQDLAAVQSLILELGAKTENHKNEIIGILNSRASTKAKIQRYDTMMEQAQEKEAELLERKDQLRLSLRDQKRQEEEATKALEEVCGEILALTEKGEELSRRIETLKQELTERAAKQKRSEAKYNRESSRLEALKSLTERYEGYGNSIRRVMEQRDREPGIHGVVADLIQVDAAYETAIETALGGAIQNIVTDDEETAKRLIRFLKEKRYGRATFLPLTAVRTGSAFRYPDAEKEKGAIGLADRLVTCDPRYRELIGSLLGKTLVVDNMDFGVSIAKKYRYGFRIVTTGGELINTGGSMTGGAYKHASNLLGRRREIEELTKRLAKEKETLQAAQKRTDELKDTRTELYQELDRLRDLLQEAYIRQNTAKLKQSGLETAGKELREEERRLSRESAEIAEQLQDIEEQKESIEIELETSKRLETDLSGEIDEMKARMELAKAEEETRRKTAEELHLATASLAQKDDFYKENLARLKSEVDDFAKEKAELSKNQGGVSDEIQKKRAEIEELQQTIRDSAEIFDELNAEIDTNAKKKEELTKKHRAFLDERERMSGRMSDLDKEKFRLTSRREMCEENKTKLYNYMWEEYEITYSLAKDLRDPSLTDLSGMKKRMQEIKSAIRALGSVNVNAIDDYRELLERYEFLTGQREDLLTAEQSLVKIVDELDEAMRRQFTERFAAISREFNTVFSQLFGGGKGRLELVEDEDVLEAGVRIIAQPPGKKLQNMMQMSGGEKALTAIALLFAIQNLKPSPFCLLDEIEAALDDSNVGRFAQYLHRLTTHTQFIVITHRRGTMAAADRLYGITMQEKGISTLVSVDLLEDELDD